MNDIRHTTIGQTDVGYGQKCYINKRAIDRILTTDERKNPYLNLNSYVAGIRDFTKCFFDETI